MSQIHVYSNTVATVRNPPTLVMLLPANGEGWCQQFSEEGYVVIHVPYPPERPDTLEASLADVQKRLSTSNNLSGWAMLTYGLLPEDNLVPSMATWSGGRLKACVHFSPLADNPLALLYNDEHLNYVPTILHLPSALESLQAALVRYTDPTMIPDLPTHEVHPIQVYTYPRVPSSPPFPLATVPPTLAVAGQSAGRNLYIESATSLSYTRSLELIRRYLGPHFDFEALWDRHTYYEFAERDYKKTMATMVSNPYVNHIPTMAGGVGYKNLARFYEHHFTNVTPPDCETITISRTIGVNRIIDELLFKCTHTTEIDYFLPGVKPTGKPLEIAIVAIVSMRGDKLAFEHIYWDQASLLVQVGLLDPTNLPIGGYDVTRKVTDPMGMPSNTLVKRWSESEGLTRSQA